MTFFRRIPGRNIANIKHDIDRFYDEFFDRRFDDTESMGKISPLVSLEETDNNYVVTAELPGMKKDEVKITFQDGKLSISGEKKAVKESDEGNFHRYEREYGSFCRMFNIPTSIKSDKIKASYESGVLEVVLPKAEEAKSKEIHINVN